jgi:two-component system response regulator AlgR
MWRWSTSACRKWTASNSRATSSLLEQPPAVIFVTAYDAYAVQAFELNAVDYLVKPVRASVCWRRCRKCGTAARAAAGAGPVAAGGERTHLSCHERGRLLLIPVSDIVYLKADLKYVTARTVSREYLLDESLTHLEQEFGDTLHPPASQRTGGQGCDCRLREECADDAARRSGRRCCAIAERLPVSRRQWPLVKILREAGSSV